ncbi:MAG: oligosaccharide flippase family protein [Anaerolineae bacterium]|nr:oligosaccharide flippase family protein [Anaerolineae bacterium]
MRAETVRRRALSGVLALVGRSALARLITLAGMVVVARLLTPADFGAWELIAFPTLLVTQLTEAGLAEALARMPAAPDARDLGPRP